VFGGVPFNSRPEHLLLLLSITGLVCSLT
jgi:hypothetical protein